MPTSAVRQRSHRCAFGLQDEFGGRACRAINGSEPTCMYTQSSSLVAHFTNGQSGPGDQAKFNVKKSCFRPPEADTPHRIAGTDTNLAHCLSGRPSSNWVRVTIGHYNDTLCVRVRMCWARYIDTCNGNTHNRAHTSTHTPCTHMLRAPRAVFLPRPPECPPKTRAYKSCANISRTHAECSCPAVHAPTDSGRRPAVGSGERTGRC